MPDTMTETPPADIGHNSAGVGEMLKEQPALLYQEPDMLGQLCAEIETEINAADINLDSISGRNDVAKRAYAIATLKTAIFNAGKGLTVELRDKVKAVNDIRNSAESALNELRDKARAPLTEWEEAENARTQTVSDFFESLSAPLPVGITDKLQEVLYDLQMLEIDSSVFRERTDEAEAAVIERMRSVEQYISEAKKAEADRQELERLRKEEEERKVAEAKATAEKVAREAEERRKAEVAERIKAAEENAAREAEAKARQEAEAAEAERRAEEQRRLDVANAAKEEAERQLREKEEAEAREREEAAKRQADRDHRAKVQADAAFSLQAHGMISEAAAADLVTAIAAGNIPHVTLSY